MARDTPTRPTRQRRCSTGKLESARSPTRTFWGQAEATAERKAAITPNMQTPYTLLWNQAPSALEARVARLTAKGLTPVVVAACTTGLPAHVCEADGTTKAVVAYATKEKIIPCTGRNMLGVQCVTGGRFVSCVPGCRRVMPAVDKKRTCGLYHTPPLASTPTPPPQPSALLHNHQEQKPSLALTQARFTTPREPPEHSRSEVWHRLSSPLLRGQPNRVCRLPLGVCEHTQTAPTKHYDVST